VKVAVGKNDRTPEGGFRIAGKAKHVTWTPPPSMAKKFTHPVKWGEKGYPLGKEGYFMVLRGTDSSTRGMKGYGIHGTNAQWSIGKAASHGCIRVGEGDIATLWAMMTEGSSTVQIVH
jgi:lipoprotein-anchoring transpeptidase ErfK/SrfK